MTSSYKAGRVKAVKTNQIYEIDVASLSEKFAKLSELSVDNVSVVIGENGVDVYEEDKNKALTQKIKNMSREDLEKALGKSLKEKDTLMLENFRLTSRVELLEDNEHKAIQKLWPVTIDFSKTISQLPNGARGLPALPNNHKWLYCINGIYIFGHINNKGDIIRLYFAHDLPNVFEMSLDNVQLGELIRNQKKIFKGLLFEANMAMEAKK